MNRQCTKEQFKHDVREHRTCILKEDGLYRHLRVAKPGTMVYGYEIITWPGYLTITGDMGSYTFTRVSDMFGFFRMSENDFNNTGELSINPRYWQEKLACKDVDVEQYSDDVFKAQVKYQVEQYYEDYGGCDMINKLDTHYKFEKIWDELKYDAEFETTAIQAAMNYRDEEDHRPFQDFWEVSCREYKYQYIWCLYAIVHAITEYDARKKSFLDTMKENMRRWYEQQPMFTRRRA